MEEADRRRRSQPLHVCGTGEFYRYNRTVDTSFYKVVSAHQRRHYGEFRRVYDDLHGRGECRGSPWMDGATRIIGKFLECGNLKKGFARVRCEDCGHERFVVFSCDRPDGGNAAVARDGKGAAHQKRTLNFAHYLRCQEF